MKSQGITKSLYLSPHVTLSHFRANHMPVHINVSFKLTDQIGLDFGFELSSSGRTSSIRRHHRPVQ